jgi:hypothetical protein
LVAWLWTQKILFHIREAHIDPARTLMKPDVSGYEVESLIDGGRWQMSKVQFERIWIAQCKAGRRVKNRFGLANALDYLIGEKLLTFAQVAEGRAEFMHEMPDFLQEIRAVFSLEETSEYATQLECTRRLSPFQHNALRAISSVSAHVH